MHRDCRLPQSMYNTSRRFRLAASISSLISLVEFVSLIRFIKRLGAQISETAGEFTF